MPTSSEEEPSQQRKLRPHPPKASPSESARKGFRHAVADRRRSGEVLKDNGGSSSLHDVHRSYHRNEENHSCSKQGRSSSKADAEKMDHLSSREHNSSANGNDKYHTLSALEAEIRVLSKENASFRSRNQELLDRLDRTTTLNEQLESKLILETNQSHQLQILQASHSELLSQLEQAQHTIHELQQIESLLKQDIEDLSREHAEKQKTLTKKLSSMELVQQQVVMENSRLHSDIRKEKTLRQNCEAHLRSHNNNNKDSYLKPSPRLSRHTDSFLSPDTFSRARDKARSPIRTAGKPSSPLPSTYQSHSVREPPPRLEGVIHLDNRGRTNQQTFDLFKPIEEPAFTSPRPIHRHLTPHRSTSHRLRPSPFSHERNVGEGSRSSAHSSPPYATNVNRASELALARLEQRLLGLHQEKQNCEDELTKLDRARATVLGRKRKVELDAILGQLQVEITNVKTAIRRLGLS